jgi:hypothetical protein
MNSNSYSLEKVVWSDADFDEMGWHDVQIHGIAFYSESWELAFDIDYLFKWELNQETNAYSFWIAPCTLVFEGVGDLKMDARPQYVPSPEIAEIKQQSDTSSNCKRYIYKIDLHDHGVISLSASGFHQYTRRKPVLAGNQSLSVESRGGISFERTEKF